MAKPDIVNAIKSEIGLYRHKIFGKVKFAEVDSFGVVHNIQYLYMLEWARTEYLQSIGIKLNPATFITQLPLMVVHSEIDYFDSLRFNDEYCVLTRISMIKDTSFVFDNLIFNKNDDLIVKGSSIMVHIDAATKSSKTLPDFLRQTIKEFEK